MDGILQRVVAIIISVVILFILPVYVAYEKKDDISYALALKITTDFVENVKSKGYISQPMYLDFTNKLATTDNSYDIYLEHTAKKYNPVIYSYTDDLKTIRGKFDYNLYKDEYKAGEINITDGENIGTYTNLILAYDVSEKIYTKDQILATISTNVNALSDANNLEYYRGLDYMSLPATSNLYKLDGENNNIYTMSEGDEFNVIIKNKNTTPASVIFNLVTFGAGSKNNTKVYVNYGGTIKAESYRNRSVNDDTANNNEKTTANTQELVNSYITDGLVALYDGEYNSGTSHSNNTEVWQDLSGNGNNAVLSSFDFNDESGWIFNGLQFTGKESITIPDIDSEEYTVEIVAKIDDVKDDEVVTLLSNINSGGLGLEYVPLTNISETADEKGKVRFRVSYLDDVGIAKTREVVNNNIMQYNKITSMSGSFGKIAIGDMGLDDASTAFTTAMLLGVNGEVNGIDFLDTYVKPATGTKFTSGGTPTVGATPTTNFIGTIYSIRVYNRALTAEEIQENYNIDKEKYGIS